MVEQDNSNINDQADADLIFREPFIWDPKKNFVDLVAKRLYMVPIAILSGVLSGIVIWTAWIYLLTVVTKLYKRKFSNRRVPQNELKSRDGPGPTHITNQCAMKMTCLSRNTGSESCNQLIAEEGAVVTNGGEEPKQDIP